MERAMKIRKKIAKLCLLLLAAGICLLAAAGIVLGVEGYALYKNGVEESPVAEKLREAQEDEDFVPFEKLPAIYVEAVTAAEDQRFWAHRGIDLISIGRAALCDLVTLSFQEGGSTITQQLAKNQYFTQEKKIRRKIGEIFMALEIERECSKREIFEWYVNTIYFGSGYYGIRDAARGYFGKEPEELSDGEAVLLAGLPNAPSVYGSNICSSLTGQRTRQVADQMAACGMLSRQEAEKLCADIGDFVTEKREKTEYDGTR